MLSVVLFPAALIQVLIILVVVGLILWAITKLPLDATIVQIIRVVIIVIAALWALEVLVPLIPVSR